MTPTEKQKTISEQAIYGDLRIQVGDSIRVANGTFTEYRGEYVRHVEFECKDTTGMLNINKIKPILRPLDLTKEITHRGYNNNEPFIPLVELAKIIKPNFKSYELNVSNQEVLCLMEGHSRRYELYLFDSKEILLEEFDLLNRLHFDTRKLIEESEAISTDEVNPYEV